MTTETLDRLYLEWSQFTKTRNFRERKMNSRMRIVADELQVMTHLARQVKTQQDRDDLAANLTRLELSLKEMSEL